MPQNHPGYRLPSDELANWLERQGSECWWSVDGDPLLTGLVSFPTTGDVLAAKLRKINKPLLVIDDRDESGPSEISADDLDRHLYFDEFSRDRLFRLRWDSIHPGVEWLLIEDKESAERARSSDVAEDD